MNLLQYLEGSILMLVFLFSFNKSQEDPPKPTFPDVFQVEVQGIFQEERSEMDAFMYYDKPKNRAVLTYTYQNDTTTSIYDFDQSQLIYIQGLECKVTEISKKNPSFFPFDVDRNTGKKTIASAEEMFFFTKSKLDRQELSIFPSYVYSATIDILQYGLKDCEVVHIFSKPELEMPDCEGHSCRSTLVSISVKCPAPEGEPDATEVFHIYNFFRFRSSIPESSIFQPPQGVHCDVASSRPFPELPAYFSFSYELVEEQKNSGESSGVFTTVKRVWYDSKLELIRMDEFDKDGLLVSSRIFDFYGQTAYTVVASVPICQPNELERDIALHEMTRLPKIFFAKKAEDRNAVYIGKRSVHGLEYDVWTKSIVDDQTEATVVQEFYFTNNIPKGLIEKRDNYLQLSHADLYTYEKDEKGKEYQLTILTYLSISNFRQKPKEWEAFDISSCFSGEKRKGFILKVNGPAIVKNSLMYEELLEKLYMNLIMLTNASVIRISQLKGRFDGIYISEFTGWILSKVQREGVENLEPDMQQTYNLIEQAAAEGNLTIKVKRNNQDQEYKITSVIEPITSVPDCISGGTMAAVSLVLLFMGITFGIVGYHVFLKKRFSFGIKEDKVPLETVLGD